MFKTPETGKVGNGGVCKGLALENINNNKNLKNLPRLEGFKLEKPN